VLKGGVALAVLGVLFLAAGILLGLAVAQGGLQSLPGLSAPETPRPAFAGLERAVSAVLDSADATGGVTLAELGGPSPQTWSYNGDEQFVAASTYKLALLMEEAQNVASGRWHGMDSLCYEDDDWEDGFFTDYQDGVCMSRSQLDQRVGLDSDNTAAHILVRYDGGTDALNAYAKSHGASESAFYDPNTTTAADLARLLSDEAGGRAGGRAAQQYLYPMLTHTVYEDGIPAGVPHGTTVVHKIGVLGSQVNDAALVPRGPRGGYVLAICTQGPGGDAGWRVLADISRDVWQFEASR